MLWWLGFCLLFLALPSCKAHACGGCYRLPYQTLLEKIVSSDRVVVAHPTAGSLWKIDEVIKGQVPKASEWLDVNVSTTSPGPQILRWNRVTSSWTVDCPASPELVVFLKEAANSPPNLKTSSARQQAQRLRYFLPYLEHRDAKIADSAHAKLSGAPYAVIQELAEDLDRAQLLEWIEKHSSAIKKRVALFVTLLGICGDDRDAEQVKQWIDNHQSGGEAAYLAALLTSHVELHGEQAVRFIEGSYIRNRDRTLGELIAAVDALRTHGQADTTISRDRIKTSFHLLLRERPPLAELIIDDFTRWQDWTLTSKLIEIYAKGEQPWNNALITSYLEACPLASAKDFLKRAAGDTEAPTAVR